MASRGGAGVGSWEPSAGWGEAWAPAGCGQDRRWLHTTAHGDDAACVPNAGRRRPKGVPGVHSSRTQPDRWRQVAWCPGVYGTPASLPTGVLPPPPLRCLLCSFSCPCSPPPPPHKHPLLPLFLSLSPLPRSSIPSSTLVSPSFPSISPHQPPRLPLPGRLEVPAPPLACPQWPRHRT